MKVSQKGLDLIKFFEGLRLKPYRCAANVPTIGYGNTRYLDGRIVSMSDAAITEEYADKMLEETVNDYANQAKRYIKRELNQNQFDALVSFAYNCGVPALKKSTLLKRVNANPCDLDIHHQFMRWNKAGGKIQRGLTKRRKMEAELYFS